MIIETNLTALTIDQRICWVFLFRLSMKISVLYLSLLLYIVQQPL